MLNRRKAFAAGALALGLIVAGSAKAADQPGTLRLGYQKAGILVVARNQQVIEKRLGAKGIETSWIEFTSGPPLLEAMNAGSIDIGLTGDTPPIFAQAAGAAITYVAALAPNGPGEAILVKPDSPIRTVADLAGKRIGFKRGSSANNLVVAALAKAGVPWTSVKPFDLGPAEGMAAFDGDSVDAWAIWDPFFAVAELRYQPRVLVTSADVLDANTFLLANDGFAASHGDVLREAIAGFAEAADWATSHPDQVAEAVHAVTGVELAALKRSTARATFFVRPIDERIIANQQATADRFRELGLLPKAVAIRDAVWKGPQS
jgi:sulfonate transport system substrate-binding protein